LRPTDIQNSKNLAELGRFCRTMGREAHQGEVGLVIGDEYFAIRDFALDEQMKTQLDMDKIAAALGAERRGTVSSTGGTLGRCSCGRTLKLDSVCRQVAGDRPTRAGPKEDSFRSHLERSNGWRRSRPRSGNIKA
jgi:hypothetical protein